MIFCAEEDKAVRASGDIDEADVVNREHESEHIGSEVRARRYEDRAKRTIWTDKASTIAFRLL